SFLLTLIIITISVISGFGFYKFYQVNKKLRAAIPYLFPGEKIEYFDILGQDAKIKNLSDLNSNRTSLIFIFSRPCSPCNKNIVYWKKIASILGDKVKAYGIVLGKINETFELTEKTTLDFDVYVPENLPKFIEMFRLKLNFPQTLIYQDHKVIYQKLGELEGEDAAVIIKKAQETV
ncbi:MAG TPA: hypothetical protein VK469_19390, partial [Candidatus Kapabacteria bacterium]|nr:hypothetical protein [Candidatus Kapabacteria bacterium]